MTVVYQSAIGIFIGGNGAESVAVLVKMHLAVDNFVSALLGAARAVLFNGFYIASVGRKGEGNDKLVLVLAIDIRAFPAADNILFGEAARAQSKGNTTKQNKSN